MFISLDFREGLIKTSRPGYERLDADPIWGVFTVALQPSFNSSNVLCHIKQGQMLLWRNRQRAFWLVNKHIKETCVRLAIASLLTFFSSWFIRRRCRCAAARSGSCDRSNTASWYPETTHNIKRNHSDVDVFGVRKSRGETTTSCYNTSNLINDRMPFKGYVYYVITNEAHTPRWSSEASVRRNSGVPEGAVHSSEHGDTSDAFRQLASAVRAICDARACRRGSGRIPRALY